MLAGKIDSDLDEIPRKQSFPPILVTAVDLAIRGFDDLAKVHLAQSRKPRAKQILEPHLSLGFSNSDLDPTCHMFDSIARKKMVQSERTAPRSVLWHQL